MWYTNLPTEAERQEVIEIGNNLARYLHKNRIGSIIFADRSARPGYIALKRAWKNLFPHEKSPDIYFTNPEGYNINNRTIDEIIEEFDSTYTKLSSNKNQKIILFDVCMHSGETMQPVINVLKEAGYGNVFMGLAQPKDERFNCSTQIDFSALSKTSKGYCYPFNRDHMVEKTRCSVLSSKNNNLGDRTASNRLRKEISSLF